MKQFLAILLLCMPAMVSAQKGVLTKSFAIPDTLKATQWFAEVSVNTGDKGVYGTSFHHGSLGLQKKGKKKTIVFKSASPVEVIAKGLNTIVNKHTVRWTYNWQQDQPYQLLITALADSATHASYYTGYIFLPVEKKWKLIASFKTISEAKLLKSPAITAAGKSSLAIDKQVSIQEAWIQRTNGSWKNLLEDQSKKSPVISVTNHIDSTAQAANDRIEILNSKTAITDSSESVYYSMIREGTGAMVKLTDTVRVFYKGFLLKDGTVFDQTKDKPATFPLSRLIKGWQLGLVNCRVGGKIRMIIPSGIAYSVRSRSKDIPPNSVLVFEVEVVEAKPAGGSLL